MSALRYKQKTHPVGYETAINQQPSITDIESWKGTWILAHSAHERRDLVDQAHAYWRNRGFPFPSTSQADADLQMQRLKRSVWARNADQLIESADTAGLRLANSYHPQMWSVRAYGRKRSPLDYFKDNQVLARMLERAPRFWPNRSCWNAQCVRSLFRIASPGRVANFRPMVAAGIIRKFCPPEGQVVDFCSGYGGRLVSAIACGVRYFGIDASMEQIAGSQQITADLQKITGDSVALLHGSAPEMLNRLAPRSADLVFTSPPYFDLERYSSDAMQSYLQFPSYDTWREKFLKNSIEQSRRVLKSKGFLVLNVANNRRFPLATDAAAIMSKVFGNVTSYEMRMRRLPSYAHFGSAHRAEQILISFKQSSSLCRPARNQRDPTQ